MNPFRWSNQFQFAWLLTTLLGALAGAATIIFQGGGPTRWEYLVVVFFGLAGDGNSGEVVLRSDMHARVFLAAFIAALAFYIYMLVRNRPANQSQI